MKIVQRKGYLVIKCRACGTHLIPTYQEPGKRWTFNGNFDKPTITPSVNESCNDPGHPSYNAGAKSSRCHYIVTDGKIAYQGDCTHNLKGQTVELEDFTQAEIDLYAKQDKRCSACNDTGIMKGDKNAPVGSILREDVPCPECQDP